ncbi:hypothetical protein [Bifidobacterium pseudolongum]|uniref:hypothetical protein n=1 Tax=Bifidobacterium pseudolongum TaxID=1694 RepID=UPI0013E9A110|nr:hypothetical protein [Bifidobacterium pseudolongum]
MSTPNERSTVDADAPFELMDDTHACTSLGTMDAIRRSPNTGATCTRHALS